MAFAMAPAVVESLRKEPREAVRGRVETLLASQGQAAQRFSLCEVEPTPVPRLTPISLPPAQRGHAGWGWDWRNTRGSEVLGCLEKLRDDGWVGKQLQARRAGFTPQGKPHLPVMAGNSRSVQGKVTGEMRGNS